MSWKGWKIRITILWLSDDVHWFSEDTTQESLDNLRPNRAGVWWTSEGEEWISFFWYLRDFHTRLSGAPGFIIWTWKDKMIFDEVGDTQQALDDSNWKAMWAF